MNTLGVFLFCLIVTCRFTYFLNICTINSISSLDEPFALLDEMLKIIIMIIIIIVIIIVINLL